MPLPKLPTNSLDDINQRRRRIETLNNVLDFTFDDSRVRTPAEVAAGITPLNYAYAPGDFRRYGASDTYDDNVDDLPFINAAIAALGPNGGKFTGAYRTYRVNGTVDISTMVAPDFGTSNNGNATGGFILFSDTDAPILRFNSGSRFIHWSNFSIVGNSVLDGGSGNTAQYGIVVNNAGARLTNFVVRAAGAAGLFIVSSYAGTYRDGYISLCDGDGVLVSGGCGGNRWSMITSAGNGGDGFDIDLADGGDHMQSTDAEGNAGAGLRFKSGVIGWQVQAHHSETNAGGSLVFASGSNRNKVNFRSWGDSAGTDLDPVNSGGTDNTWSGLKFSSGGGGFNNGYIEPKLIQRVYTEYSAVSSASPNAIPYDDTIPQSNEGATFLSQAITPKRSGDILKVIVKGFAEISVGAVLVVSLFKDSETDARYAIAHATAVDTPIPFSFEYQFTTTSISAVTFAVNIGSGSAGATVTFNGSGGNRRFGAIAKSSISIEEFWPMS